MADARTWKVLSACCGLGGNALGILRARSGVGSRFVSVGAFDVDAEACADFERLTGARAQVVDFAELEPDQLAARCTGRPDFAFLSPPCTGFSGCLPEERSAEPHYQELNELAVRIMFLLVAAWPMPPAIICLENVPRMRTRGRAILGQITALLQRSGYHTDLRTHDCGALGQLAQRRERLLLVARHAQLAPTMLAKPSAKPYRSIAEVLWPLPVPTPGAERGGALHRLPALSRLNWLRLAAIRAGHDWRDLPDAIALPARRGRLNGGLGVEDAGLPAHVVVGSNSPAQTWGSVADPRLEWSPRRGTMGVVGHDEPMPVVIGSPTVRNAVAAIADARVNPRSDCARREGALGVCSGSEPFPTAVIGDATSHNGPWQVADPREGFVATHRLRSSAALDVPRRVWTSARVELEGAPIEFPRRGRPEHLLVVAPDGTIHRPLTVLELAVLQGFPAWHAPGDPTQLELGDPRGRWLELSGSSAERWRRRIGNAVPPPSAEAIGREVLEVLDAGEDEHFRLSATGVWVAPTLIDSWREASQCI